MVSNSSEFKSKSNTSNKMRDFMNGLRLGGFRLGKTVVCMSTSGEERRVFAISADSKLSPDYEESYQFFHFSENFKNGVFSGYSSVHSKDLIVNLLENHLKEKEIDDLFSDLSHIHI